MAKRIRDPLPAGLARPARRALEAAKIGSLQALSGWALEDLRALHGIGPSALTLLKKELDAKGLSLAKNATKKQAAQVPGRADVDAYFRALPKQTHAVLQEVRTVLRKALPRAEEVISYRIPMLKVDGRMVLFFAGWKEHYAVYPATPGLVETFARDLAPYEVRKGTVRFPLSKPIPKQLLARLARFRAAEAAARST